MGKGLTKANNVSQNGWTLERRRWGGEQSGRGGKMGRKFNILNKNSFYALKNCSLIQPNERSFNKRLFFSKFIISVSGGHCDYLGRAPKT